MPQYLGVLKLSFDPGGGGRLYSIRCQ